MNFNQFKNWAISQGSVTTPVNTYKGECVSLIQQYLDKVYGIPFQPRGHAKDWATNKNVLSNFNKVADLKAGDILVYPTAGEYGHIEIYSGNNQSLQQNRGLDGKVHVSPLWTKYPYVILRSKKGGEEMLNDGDSENVTDLFGEKDKRFKNQAWSAVFYFYLKGKVEGLKRDLHNATWIADERLKQINELKAQQGDNSEANLLGKALIKLITQFGYKKG